MTAPLLTPADTAIFDEDVIRDLEEHQDDVLPCRVSDRTGKCEREATHVLVCRICNRQSCHVCGPHGAWAAESTVPATHTVCGIRGPIRELVRVVPL